MKKLKLYRPTISQIIILIVSLSLAVGLFFISKNLAACWRLTALPGIVPQSCSNAGIPPQPTSTESLQADTTPIVGLTPVPIIPTVLAPGMENLPPWDGVERVTILIIGLDARDWELGTGAPRSDTMMLLTLDPVAKIAGMMSIPRDMWVNIPDFGYNRINTAYSLGESWKLPGGGPGLAIKTVEDFLGIPIQYYAQIDFHVFERIVDEIGGIIVTPDQTVTLDRIGDGDLPVTIQAGETVALPGDLALAYARARKTENGDVDRARRQQEVIIAIKNRFLANFEVLAPKILPLYNEISSGLNTNMTLTDAVRLLELFLLNHKMEIQRGIIDYTMAEPITLILPDGGGTAEVLKAIPDQIRILRDRLFKSGGALSPLATGDLLTLISDEGARVALYSSSTVDGLANRSSEYFKSQGLNIISIGNSTVGSNKTIVIDHTGNPYTLRFLMETMNLDSSQITTSIDFNSSSDVEIHLGNDWASNNPMP